MLKFGMKKTILIFGISSFVGANLARILSKDYRIVGTYLSNPVNLPGITCVPCDVLKKTYVTKIMAIFRPDYTIYAVGLSSLTACKLNPKLADALNSAGAANCTAASERYGSKFIYLSSCFVLGGENTLYRESDTPFPVTTYGNSLSSTEFYIQRSSLNYLILRCAPLYGRSYNPLHPNWFEIVQTALAKKQILPADDSVYTGFLDIEILGKILRSLLESGVTNRLLQVSSRDSLTRLGFAKLYAKVFKKDGNFIESTSGTFPLEASYKNTQKNTSLQNYFQMDVTNVESLLGIEMPKIEDSLVVTYQRLNA